AVFGAPGGDLAGDGQAVVVVDLVAGFVAVGRIEENRGGAVGDGDAGFEDARPIAAADADFAEAIAQGEEPVEEAFAFTGLDMGSGGGRAVAAAADGGAFLPDAEHGTVFTLGVDPGRDSVLHAAVLAHEVELVADGERL